MTNVSARATSGHRSSDDVIAEGFQRPRPAPVDGISLAGHEGDLSAVVAAARNGDQESFRLLYRGVQPLLLRYLRALVGDDAEDVASEAWLQIVRDLRSFEGDYDGFRGWSATIARHRAMDHLRRMRRRPSTPVPLEKFNDLADEADPAMQAMQSMSTETAIRLIGTLPRDQAEAVLLRVVMGLDAATAGKVLGKRSGAVRTAAYRGLRRLADRLRQAEAALPERAALDEKGVTSGEATALRTVR